MKKSPLHWLFQKMKTVIKSFISGKMSMRFYLNIKQNQYDILPVP